MRHTELMGAKVRSYVANARGRDDGRGVLITTTLPFALCPTPSACTKPTKFYLWDMSHLFSEIHRFKALLGNLYDPGEASSITNLVFEEVLKLTMHQLRFSGERGITEEEHQQLDDILHRLLAIEPIQYILGFAWFMNVRYKVNAATLIPRPETEELVAWIVNHPIKQGARILDLGTGSGCIAIEVQRKHPYAEVFAIDKSVSAINTARMNALEFLGESKKDHFFVQDMLDESWWKGLEKFDIIVSNPPYVLEEEKEEMEAHVLNHEPEGALFVPNDDPFQFYRPIAENAKRQLNSGGSIYFEINAKFGEEMKSMLELLGYEVELRLDMQGKHRMIRANLRS